MVGTFMGRWMGSASDSHGKTWVAECSKVDSWGVVRVSQEHASLVPTAREFSTQKNASNLAFLSLNRSTTPESSFLLTYLREMATFSKQSIGRRNLISKNTSSQRVKRRYKNNLFSALKDYMTILVIIVTSMNQLHLSSDPCLTIISSI